MKKDGGPAFPTDTLDGMTLRDWFAGQALAGMMAGKVWESLVIRDYPEAEAYRMADAMLAERNKQ